MPLPKTSDVGKIISFLKKDKPKMKRDQMIAIALSEVRRRKDEKGKKGKK